jgi:hypothetical protein
MAHDRNAPVDEEADGVRHLRPALELHRVAAGFLQYPGGAGEGLRRAFLIGAERHVHGDAGMGRAPHHRRAVRDHHVERHAERGVHAVEHHAERVADDEDVDMRIEEPRHRRRIGGERDDGLAALACLELRNGDALPAALRAQPVLLRGSPDSDRCRFRRSA